jgi:hypothetical protein
MDPLGGGILRSRLAGGRIEGSAGRGRGILIRGVCGRVWSYRDGLLAEGVKEGKWRLRGGHTTLDSSAGEGTMGVA